ncbi:MAG TPA: response regulator, partial [Opitutaceae bacterium]|nr:response regulator [Opitutaceae bacterium]
RSGEEAVTLYSQAQGTSRPIDLVLLDLNLTDKQRGEAVLKKLLASDPRVKTIAMSGSLDDPVLVDFASHGFCARVQKPVAMSDLKTLLHQVIPR